MTDTTGNTVVSGRSGKRSSRSQGRSCSAARRKAIVSHLSAADKKLANLIEQVGPFSMKVDELQSGYEALAESIVYQQITGKAAQSILAKVRANLGHSNNPDNFPTPQTILSASLEDLRACGLSRSKGMALHDLALKSLPDENGLTVVPSIEEMHALTDDELIQRLTQIRGIGPWTVQMLLIFRLGRLDVLPATDYGVRKGFALTYFSKSRLKPVAKPSTKADGKLKKAEMVLPTPTEIAKKAECWRPFRSAASWYLWRALELER
jgi:DNA-3-methyladenine glycosylase II